MNNWKLCLNVIAGVVLFATSLIASTPRLTNITPRGVQRGGTYTLKFHGQRLSGAQEILIYDEGLTVEKIEPGKGNQPISVTIRVDEDCRLGEHVVQVRTNDGISDFRSIFVGMFPQVNETEPNSDIGAPQVIESNVTVAGTISPAEDVDYFKVSLKKGERLSVEVEAMRLGFWFDAYLAILDSNRLELAACDDTFLLKNDPFITLVAPADGDYFIMLRESAYGGSKASRYRMHVGSFARPTAIFPAGGKPNEQVKLSFLGDPNGPIEQEVQLPSGFGFRGGLFLTQDDISSPSPIPFRINDLENIFEVEPNDAYWPEGSIGSPPFAVNGIIEQNGDSDIFRFSAKKGEEFDIECFARRIGSGLDPVINVWSAQNKKHLKGDDDARRPDSYCRFAIPADGDYFFRVKDHLGRGAPNFVYRIEFSKPQPKLGLSIPRVDRYSQLRQTIAVPQGGRFATLINANRENVSGSVELLSENLPAGITMHALPMRANLNSMPVVFEANADAEVQGRLVDFKGKLTTDKNETVIGSFSNRADFALGQPNNSVYYSCTVDRLAMAVIDPLPFKVDIVPPQSPLVRGGSKEIKIVITRDEGFTDPVTLRLPFLPPGTGTKNKINVPKGVSEITYPINANSKAQLGMWPIYVIADAKLKNGQGWTSSQLAEIEIAEPFVAFEIKRASVQRGGQTKLLCTLNQFVDFEGEATATILGLPKQVVVPPLTFTKDTLELEFEISATEDCPLGKHKGLFSQVSIPVGDETVLANAGKGELRVSKPTPAKTEEKQ